MSRKIKNIITSIVLILLIGLTIGTIYLAGNSLKVDSQATENSSFNSNMPSPPNGGERTPPDENNNTEESSIKEENNSEENSTETETKEKGNRERPSGNNKGTPPEKPSDENSNSSSEKMTPPSDNNSKENTPPSLPSSEMKDRNNSFQDSNSNNKLNVIYYIVFAVEGGTIGLIGIYWLLSGFHKKSMKETLKNKDKIIILVLATTIITGGITYLDSIITKGAFSSNKISNNNSNAAGNTVVTSKKTLTSEYSSTKEDESVVLVKDEGKATIKNATINKKSGDSTNTENSEFYGVNSGILVQSNSKATIKKSKIKTSAKGSNAVFSTGNNSKVYVSDTTIETTGESSSRGLDATYGGYIEANNVDITTKGGSSATLATDRGEGTVKATDSKLETNGSGSPVIYSTGDISISNTEGVANSSQMVVVEGKNTATVTNSKLIASGKGNRKDIDQAGIMIYQSMSGDASEGVGTFNATNSSLTIQSNSDVYKTAPMFFITNTDAVINLENTKLSYGSNILLSSKGTEEWGTEGSNGGNTTLNATNQELEGNIEIDKISTLNINLSNNSTIKGTINKDNTAKNIKIKLDKSSKLVLTGDSYITALENEDETYSNIEFNGYTLYINGTAVK